MYERKIVELGFKNRLAQPPLLIIDIPGMGRRQHTGDFTTGAFSANTVGRKGGQGKDWNFSGKNWLRGAERETEDSSGLAVEKSGGRTVHSRLATMARVLFMPSSLTS